jgi:hypothetical protein
LRRNGFIEQAWFSHAMSRNGAFIGARCIDANEVQSGAAAQPKFRTPDTLDRYVDPLPIPERLAPYGSGDNLVLFHCRVPEHEVIDSRMRPYEVVTES